MSLKMSDIARIAQVSKATVSLVLNEQPGVSESTRQRIKKIMADLHYSPLRKSRRMQTNNFGEVTLLAITTTGVVSDNYQALPFFSSLIYELSQEVDRLQGELTTITIEASDLKKKLPQLRASLNKVIVLGTDLTHDQVMFINQKIKHVVFLDTTYDDVNADFITMDNYQGARLAAQHIIAQGYHRIGYFASDKPMANFYGRRRGFRSALEEAQFKIDNRDFYFISPIETNPTGINFQELVNRDLPPAIFCEDDYIALRLIKAASQAHIRVPEDVAIMGFDDLFAGTIITPELTTIHVNIQQMATQGLQQLVNQFAHPDWLPQKSLITTTLIKRRSLWWPKLLN